MKTKIIPFKGCNIEVWVFNGKTYYLDYRVNYTNTSDIVYYNCKRLSVPIKDKYEVVREYNLRF